MTVFEVGARIIHAWSAAGPLSSALTAFPTLELLDRVDDYDCAAPGLNGFETLQSNLRAESEFPIYRLLFFGFSAAMLGISGFESSANFVEEQAEEVFPKTLRNMWVAVSFFNPVMALLALSLVKRPERDARQIEARGRDRCVAIVEAEQQRAGRVPPQPSGRMGVVVQPASSCRPSQQNVAADLFVRSRRRCRASTSSSFLDLDSQDPFAIVMLFRNRCTSHLSWEATRRIGRLSPVFPFARHTPTRGEPGPLILITFDFRIERRRRVWFLLA